MNITFAATNLTLFSTIASVLGAYTQEGFNLILTFLESLFCVLLFAHSLEKKSWYKTRLTLGTLTGIAMSYGFAVLYTRHHILPVRVLCYLMLSFLCYRLLHFCYKEEMANLLLVWCSGSGAYVIGNKVYPLIQNLLGINDKETLSLFHRNPGALQDWELILFLLFRLGCFYLLSRCFRPMRAQSHNRTTTGRILVLSVANMLVINVLLCIARTYEEESFALNIIIKILSIGFGLVVLVICGGILNQSEKEQQLAVLTQLWKQDNAQFQSVKANMDAINMKCHNLKHILSHIEDKLTETEMASLQEAIQFYDANVQTGNEILDVVLCEKSMLCQNKGIGFSCMADGKLITFLTPVQIYTLFGNMIDNAIEAVEKLPDPDSKLISLVIAQHGDTITVETSNFFSGAIQMENEMPLSQKPDAPRHGFGLKSIRYIAEQYGGSLSLRIDEDMFFLTITFPLHANRA